MRTCEVACRGWWRWLLPSPAAGLAVCHTHVGLLTAVGDMCSVLAGVEWWEDAEQASGSQRAAAGVRWWQLPKAATSDCGEAATWRAGRTASLTFVSAQPLLMANILRTCCGGASVREVSLDSPYDAAAAMQAVLQAAGLSWLDVCEWHRGHDWTVEHAFLKGEVPSEAHAGGASAKRVSLQQLLRTLTVSSLAAGAALHDLALYVFALGDAAAQAGAGGAQGADGAKGADRAKGAPAPGNMQQCLTVTADVLGAVCMRIVHGLQVVPPRSDADGGSTEGGGLLDGATMHALLVVVHHSLLWLISLALAAGHGLSSEAVSADGPRKRAAGGGVAAVRSLISAVKRSCEGLHAAVSQCSADLGDGGGVSDAISSRHRRSLAEVADEEAVSLELKSLGTAQQAALANATAALEPMLAACRRVAALLESS